MNIITKPAFEWTDENTEHAIRLRKDGNSPTEIGRRIGTTKNSVAGKMFRLGMTNGKNSPINPLSEEEIADFTTMWNSGMCNADIAKKAGLANRSAVSKRAWALKLTPRSVGRPGVPRKRLSKKPRPTDRTRIDQTRIEYEDHDGPGCQWLHGDPTKRDFCGAPAKDIGQNKRSPYCEHHHARAYVRQRKAEEQDVA